MYQACQSCQLSVVADEYMSYHTVKASPVHQFPSTSNTNASVELVLRMAAIWPYSKYSPCLVSVSLFCADFSAVGSPVSLLLCWPFLLSPVPIQILKHQSLEAVVCILCLSPTLIYLLVNPTESPMLLFSRLLVLSYKFLKTFLLQILLTMSSSTLLPLCWQHLLFP